MQLKIKYEYLLFLIAALWVLFFSYTLQLIPHFSSIGDDSSYLYAAKLLYINHTLDNTRPLLIAAIQGVPLLFGFSSKIIIVWGFIINFLFWFLTILVLFSLVANKFNRKIGFVFGVLFILCIGNLAHAFNFLSESIFIFMIVWSVYFINKFYQTNKVHYITIALLILLLNSLIKPVSIGLAVLVILFFFNKFTQIFFNKFTIALVIPLFLILFQMYSMKKNYGNFTLSYIGSITYYNYLGTKANCYRNNMDYIASKNVRIKKMSILSSQQMKKLASDDLKEQLTNNKVNLIMAYFNNIYSNSYKGNFIVSECKNVNKTSYFSTFRFLFKAISKLQNIIFTILSFVTGIYCLFKFKNTDKFYVLLSIFILYIILISAISCDQCDRFHIAFFPLLLLLLCNFIPKKPPF